MYNYVTFMYYYVMYTDSSMWKSVTLQCNIMYNCTFMFLMWKHMVNKIDSVTTCCRGMYICTTMLQCNVHVREHDDTGTMFNIVFTLLYHLVHMLYHVATWCNIFNNCHHMLHQLEYLATYCTLLCTCCPMFA